MECETLGLKRWTCSRLCPSRSGTGFWEIRARAAFDYSRLPPTGLLARNNFRLAVIRPQSPRRHGGPPLRLANCYEVGETRFP